MALKFKAFVLSNFEAHKTKRSLGDELEHRVNEWLEENENIKLVNVQQSSGACPVDPRTGDLGVLGMACLTVFYEEE